MNNMGVVRGIFLMAIALIFGLTSMHYKVGQLARTGPGLFPLIVSSMLFLIGLLTLVRARFVATERLNYNVKNILLILGGLCGFALLSQFLNMIAGILFLVFCSSFAGSAHPIVRNLKISAGLIAIAVLFKTLLGLDLPLL